MSRMTHPNLLGRTIDVASGRLAALYRSRGWVDADVEVPELDRVGSAWLSGQASLSVDREDGPPDTVVEPDDLDNTNY